MAFLRWCCECATLPGSITHPGVARSTLALMRQAERDDSASGPLTLDVYLSVWQLCGHMQFNITSALAELVRRGRLVRR